MADTATEPKNKVTIADAGPCAKKITIEVPASVVDSSIGDSLATLAAEAQLPGFRKGKAPQSLIERKFGTHIRDEAKNQLVASAYQQAIEEHKLKVIGEPTSEMLGNVKLEAGKALKFELEVEVLPEFEMPAFDGIEIKKPKLEVTDEMVKEELDRICINEGDLEPQESAQDGDYVTGHAVMTSANDEKKEFYNINGAVVQIPTPDKDGKGMVLGIQVDDLAKQIGHPKPGDNLTLRANGPDNHEVEDLRGVSVVINYEIARVDRIIPAEISQLLGMFGFEDEDQFRTAIKSRLEQRVQIRQQTVMRQQAAKHLIDSTTMELPTRLSAAQAKRKLDQQRLELMYRGVDQQKIEEHIGELRAQTQEMSQRELKLFFILNRVAEELDVKVTEAEINGRIAQLAMEQNQRPDKLRQQLIQHNQVGMIFNQIREHKTLDAIVAKGKVEEMEAEAFNTAMKELQPA